MWATTVVTAIAVVNAKAMAKAKKIFVIDSHALPETLPSCAISAQGLCVRDHKKAVSGKRRYSEYSSEVAQQKSFHLITSRTSASGPEAAVRPAPSNV